MLKILASSEMLSRINTSVSIKKQAFKALLLIAGFASIVIALTEPKWNARPQEIKRRGRDIAIAPAAVGAPLAAGLFEELIARGGRRFIVCGGSGVLDSSIGSGHIVVPTSAIRDEGTSYHYLPPTREVSASAEVVTVIERVLAAHHIDSVSGKTWTTDGIYRETPTKMAMRRAEGCLTVEMETAAIGIDFQTSAGRLQRRQSWLAAIRLAAGRHGHHGHHGQPHRRTSTAAPHICLQCAEVR